LIIYGREYGAIGVPLYLRYNSGGEKKSAVEYAAFYKNVFSRREIYVEKRSIVVEDMIAYEGGVRVTF